MKSTGGKGATLYGQLLKTGSLVVCIKKTFIAVEISSNLCGITGVKVWDP